MIDRQSHGHTFSTEEQAASVFHAQGPWPRSGWPVYELITEYDRWAHHKCNGYQPAGFGLAADDTAARTGRSAR